MGWQPYNASVIFGGMSGEVILDEAVDTWFLEHPLADARYKAHLDDMEGQR
jgi:hypothetical protein